MFPLINKRETAVNLRRIMDMRGITPKVVLCQDLVQIKMRSSAS